MNSKKLGSGVKGFTLIEMIVVMLIISILAAMLSLVIGGFQRNARIEANNNKAQMVFTGFQNQLMKCEINQDRSLFDAGACFASNPTKDNAMENVEVHFKMSEGKINDKIHVEVTYDSGDADVYATPTSNEDFYNKLKEAIESFIDPSFEGFCAVYINYEDYVVDSVICVEPAFAPNADIETSYDIDQYMAQFDVYAPYNDEGTYRMLESIEKQEECIKYTGIYFGAYPTQRNFA